MLLGVEEVEELFVVGEEGISFDVVPEGTRAIEEQHLGDVRLDFLLHRLKLLLELVLERRRLRLWHALR